MLARRLPLKIPRWLIPYLSLLISPIAFLAPVAPCSSGHGRVRSNRHRISPTMLTYATSFSPGTPWRWCNRSVPPICAAIKTFYARSGRFPLCQRPLLTDPVFLTCPWARWTETCGGRGREQRYRWKTVLVVLGANSEMIFWFLPSEVGCELVSYWLTTTSFEAFGSFWNCLYLNFVRTCPTEKLSRRSRLNIMIKRRAFMWELLYWLAIIFLKSYESLKQSMMEKWFLFL